MAYTAKYQRDDSVVCCGNVPRSILLSPQFHSDRPEYGRWRGFVEAVGHSDTGCDHKAQMFPLTKDSFDIKGESVYYTGMFLPYQVDILAVTTRCGLGGIKHDNLHTYYGRRIPPQPSEQTSCFRAKERSRRSRDAFSDSDRDQVSDASESDFSDDDDAGNASRKADRRRSLEGAGCAENMEHFSAITYVPAPFLCKALNTRDYLPQMAAAQKNMTEAFVRRLFYKVVFPTIPEPERNYDLDKTQKMQLFHQLAIVQIYASVDDYKKFYIQQYTPHESSMKENIVILFARMIESFMHGSANDDHHDIDEQNKNRHRFLTELNQNPSSSADHVKSSVKTRKRWVRNFLRYEKVKEWKDNFRQFKTYWTLVFFELDNRVHQYYAGHTVDLTLSKRWPNESSHVDYAAVLTAEYLRFPTGATDLSITRCDGAPYKAPASFQHFDIHCVYDHLLPLFLSRTAMDVVKILNDHDLSLLQHMCDSSGLSLLELFDTHLVETVIRKTKKSRNKSTLHFQNFKLKPLSGFVQHTLEPSVKRLAYGNSSEVGERDVVWVSNAIELCLTEVERAFTDNTFARVTIQEDTLLNVRRQSIVNCSFKSHMLSAALKKAASDCYLYLRRKSKFAEEIAPRIFPKDAAYAQRAASRTAQGPRLYRTEDCDPFADESYFDFPEATYNRATCNQPSPVRFLLHLHESYYNRLCDSEQYLKQMINTYSYADDLPEDVPSSTRVQGFSGLEHESFPFEMFPFDHDIAVAPTYSSIPTPAFKDLIHFPNDIDAQANWTELFASCAQPSVLPIASDQWTSHVKDIFGGLQKHRTEEQDLIRDRRNLHLVETVVKSLRSSLLKWTRTVADDSGVISQSFFNTERVMSQQTAVTLSFWFAQMRNSNTRDQVVADWRRRWGGGYLLPNCVRYLYCQNLFAETNRHTLGVLCGAHLWSIVGFEMHLAILTFSLKMIANVERRVRDVMPDASGPCSVLSHTCSYDIQMQTCRLVGMFAKRATSVRDAKTFRSESERHEFHRLLDDGIVESKAKLETLLLMRKERRIESVPDCAPALGFRAYP
ncbi:hypothetical protein CYMTET_55214 [Cymbomonas tetramitiformis]|uniref:Uncharacterized protein n=1 Tax=Cymbomonas tetramitiformis TaxID=36881 RepID=A0AAE0BFF3_9CHLO|nr:hypothetical protein CYMTET_55214 [Cymbomonas tetramitiformis]|eukprot:gene83-118_t